MAEGGDATSAGRSQRGTDGTVGAEDSPGTRAPQVVADAPDRVAREHLEQLHQLLAGARQQQAILRESLATIVGFLERPDDR